MIENRNESLQVYINRDKMTFSWRTVRLSKTWTTRACSQVSHLFLLSFFLVPQIISYAFNFYCNKNKSCKISIFGSWLYIFSSKEKHILIVLFDINPFALWHTNAYLSFSSHDLIACVSVSVLNTHSQLYFFLFQEKWQN